MSISYTNFIRFLDIVIKAGGLGEVIHFPMALASHRLGITERMVGHKVRVCGIGNERSARSSRQMSSGPIQ